MRPFALQNTRGNVALLLKPGYDQHMRVNWKQYIVSEPDVLQGKPRLKGTRIPVSLVLGYLANGSKPEQIIAEFEGLSLEQIAACLDYARDLAEFKAVV
jgi:uncharacterized protein (DUF433 family)